MFLAAKGFKFTGDPKDESKQFEGKDARVTYNHKWFSIDIKNGGDYEDSFTINDWIWDSNLRLVKRLFMWLEDLPSVIEVGSLKLKKTPGLIAEYAGNIGGISVVARSSQMYDSGMCDGVWRLDASDLGKQGTVEFNTFLRVEDFCSVVKQGFSELRAEIERKHSETLKKLKACEEVCRA
jgi:hypothetical protein